MGCNFKKITISMVIDQDRIVESRGGISILRAFPNLTGQGPEQTCLTMRLILLLAEVGPETFTDPF